MNWETALISMLSGSVGLVIVVGDSDGEVLLKLNCRVAATAMVLVIGASAPLAEKEAGR